MLQRAGQESLERSRIDKTIHVETVLLYLLAGLTVLDICLFVHVVV